MQIALLWMYGSVVKFPFGCKDCSPLGHWRGHDSPKGSPTDDDDAMMAMTMMALCVCDPLDHGRIR